MARDLPDHRLSRGFAVIGWVAMVFAAEPVVMLERIDVFSDEALDFWLDDVPRLGVGPRATAVRWIEQIGVVTAFRRASLVVSLSIDRQSVRLRRPVSNRYPLYASGGLITHLGLPAGAAVGMEHWVGPVRIGFALRAESSASWARPKWNHWRVLPGIGVGVGDSPMTF